jgi:lysophospholipase L1-like esterase
MRLRFFFFAVVFLPFISFSQVTNQRLFDTVGFLPDLYKQRLDQFAKEPVVENRIIFLGNSITQIGDWKKLLNDTAVLNRGIAGDITFGILNRLDEIIMRKPAKVFLLIGINDIGKDIPDTVVAENIGKIAGRLQKEVPSVKIYIQSILPVNPMVPNFPQHYDKQEHILRANRMIRKVAKRLNIPFVNIHDLFVDAQGRLDVKYTMDGLHLKPGGDGYTKWVAYLKKLGYL